MQKITLVTRCSLHHQIMSFAIPSQLVAWKLGLPLITTEKVVCFFVTMPFISCTLFCELAYLI